MEFLIQKTEGFSNHNKINYDFAVALLNGLQYLQWKDKDAKHYVNVCYTVDEYFDKHPNKYLYCIEKKVCPIGSVEFVCDYYEKLYGIQHRPKPINIPECLIPYSNRPIRIIDFKEGDETLYTERQLFMKSMDVIKHPNNGFICHYFKPPVGKWLLSNIINTEKDSREYRTFVENGKILDIKQYAGCNDIGISNRYDIKKIEELIQIYEENGQTPPYYTLDFMVDNNKETIYLMEIHDFFSVGLYGFNALPKIPYMFYRWNLWYLKKIAENN